jgi:hypothetical protein
MHIGTRVQVVHPPKGHKDLEALQDAIGTITRAVEHVGGHSCAPNQFRVTFDHPVGPRGWINFEPLGADHLKEI